MKDEGPRLVIPVDPSGRIGMKATLCASTRDAKDQIQKLEKMLPDWTFQMRRIEMTQKYVSTGAA
jgi:hypothetical protein